MRWKTSTHRCPGGNCVEIAHTPSQVHVRDSKHRSGPTLTIPAGQWATFLNHLT